MCYHIATRWLPALAFLSGVAAPGMPAWAQHHGGHHYGGHHIGHAGFGTHFGLGHHYYPYYYGGYYGPGYGSYGYDSWPYSYTPHVYSYSGPPTVYVDPPAGGTSSSYGATSAATSDATAAGLGYQRRAESAFRSHHYDEAIDWAKRAAKERPRDGRVFLLLSQIHLAVGEYRDAAGAARVGMSLLPQEDWGYVVKNFRSYYHDADYVAQVRRLERFIAENPSHADARFLLGYHWAFLGHPKAANRELAKAAELNPRDEWASGLLKVVIGAAPPTQPTPPETVPGTRSPSEPASPNQPTRSVDASVEYPPPQEFEKPLKTGGPDAAGHKHEQTSK